MSWFFSPLLAAAQLQAAGGGSVESGAGTAAGAATVSGVGASTAASAGTSNGLATASGTGASTAASAGTSAGVATASAVGASTAASVGTSAGAAVVSGVGDVAPSAGSAAGTSAGTSTASGVGASTVAAAGTAAGSASASGAGAARADSAGTSAGLATATGVGTDGSIVEVPPAPSSGGYDVTDDDNDREEHFKKRAAYIAKQIATPPAPAVPGQIVETVEPEPAKPTAPKPRKRAAKSVDMGLMPDADPVTDEIAALEAATLAREAADEARAVDEHNQRIKALLLMLAVAA